MERPEDAPRYQIAALCGVIAIIALGELLIGPPTPKAWTALDAFLVVACFGVAAMLLSARTLVRAWPLFGFLGGAVLASLALPLTNAVWLASHAAAALAGVTAGALLLWRAR